VGSSKKNTPKLVRAYRSASQIDRDTQRLWRGVEEPVLTVAEGTSAVLILPMLLGAFRPPKPDNRICCDRRIEIPAHNPFAAVKMTIRGKGWPYHGPQAVIHRPSYPRAAG
jgi:hypothetical protein